MSIPPSPHTVFQYTEPSNTTWTYGKKTESSPEGKEWVDGGEQAGWKVFDTATADPAKLNQLLTSGIIPRPIAFVSTVSEAGLENIAPFSWFNMVAARPPTIMISFRNGPERDNGKDSKNNIQATKGFVVNIISEPWVNQANIASIDAPEDESEWPLSGLTKEPSIHVKAPRVKESAFSMECELLQSIDIMEPVSNVATTTLILGTIKYVHVRKDVLNDKGNIDPGKLKPVARMGDVTFSRVVEGFRLPKPLWEKYKKDIEEQQ